MPPMRRRTAPDRSLLHSRSFTLRLRTLSCVISLIHHIILCIMALLQNEILEYRRQEAKRNLGGYLILFRPSQIGRDQEVNGRPLQVGHQENNYRTRRLATMTDRHGARMRICRVQS
jgi:hypothetical protein